MSWGNSWGNSRSGNSDWGTSKWGSSAGTNEDINGQHRAQCGAYSSVLGNNQNLFDDKCPGCRRERSVVSWGSNNITSNGAQTLFSLFVGAKIAKKSLWD